MLRIYLGKNKIRNKTFLEQLEKYGVCYEAHHVEDLDKLTLLEMMSYSVDCFEFLSPTLLRFKRSDYMTTNQLIELILSKKSTSLRLPLAIHKRRVYPDLSSDDLRTFIPRKLKLGGFRQTLNEQSEV
ncbi:arsenate reductase-like glutaredoxin family protein [Streptococcus rupicaprae]|uniref:Arsenate reductase-like glutaredoxin family protein n=1 Tax=Streptococcus rupicaprae TaxID=759619 RepID=A0ABV2FL63_9STRE